MPIDYKAAEAADIAAGTLPKNRSDVFKMAPLPWHAVDNQAGFKTIRDANGANIFYGTYWEVAFWLALASDDTP